jgi:FtsZ-binding cell division protein ZapB
MEQFDKYIDGIKHIVNSQDKTIKLYEHSTKADYVKIQKYIDFIKDLEIYIHELEINVSALNHAALEQKIKIDALEKQNKKLDDIIKMRV